MVFRNLFVKAVTEILTKLQVLDSLVASLSVPKVLDSCES